MTTSPRAIVRTIGVAVLALSACAPVTRSAPPVSTPVVLASPRGSTPASDAASPRRHRPTGGGTGGQAPDAGQGEPGVPGDPAVVISTVDGDTIHVRYRGRTLDVRLIGVDTPETVDPSQPVQCFGEAASRFTAHRLTGRPIHLEFDAERRDRYGRTLAYVWLGGSLFNRRLVARGYATVSTYPPDVRYVRRFEAAQRAARAAHRGLWQACAADHAGGRGCDPAYPGVCIPSPPPDLDCADVRFHDFRVLPPDPQNFDGDHNGRGCET
jgi:endonuclease YncB( thermonuclease family)